MHTRWQVPGQTLGQESGLITSVKVSWRPGPSCRHRGRPLYNWQQCLMWTMPQRRNYFNILNWCVITVLTGLFSVLHLWSGGAERGWTPQLPPAQGYVSGSEHTQRHRNIERDTLTSLHPTLCGTSSRQCGKREFDSVSLQEFYKLFDKYLLTFWQVTVKILVWLFY